MHLKSCCALFLLALIACQAAPSPKLEQTISEAETTFNQNGIQLEETGAEKERAKKSAATFCVELRAGKPEQVPCRPPQEVRPQGPIQQEISKPVVIVQPIPIPAPVPVDYPKQPIIIQPQLPQPLQPPQLPQPPQPQPSQDVHSVPQQVPVPAPAPAPAPVPIINIVPQAPAPAPCEKPTIVQPQQPQHIHTVHVIHPQPQPTPRPMMLIQQEVKPQKEEKPISKLQPVLIPHQELAFIKQKDSYKSCDRPHLDSLEFFVPQPSQTTFFKAPEVYKPQDEAYECSCRSENRIPTLTPYVTSRFAKKPVYFDGASFESVPMRPSLLSTENNPSIMSDQPIFLASEGAREAEGRHHHRKQYNPVNLSVQFPVVYPGSDNLPKYYEPVYRPTYTNPYYTYSNPTYPSSYTYGASYPGSYDAQTSVNGVPTITVNTGGPFYRESQHVDSLSPSNEPREASPTNEIIDASNNQKRETE